MRTHPLIVVISFLTACSADNIASRHGTPARTLSVAVGQELDLTLQTVGPGQYDSLPIVSSSALRFLDASFVFPAVPAGPTQRFRFRAEAPGQAVITFNHTG